jgi:hypothetical protein
MRGNLVPIFAVIAYLLLQVALLAWLNYSPETFALIFIS